MEEYQQKSKMGRIWRTIAIVAVALVFVVLIVISLTSKPAAGDQVWNEATTVGDMQAKNSYVMYTDLMCPYCDVFSREIMHHWDEFKDYIAEHDILFEIRLTDYLYEGSGIEGSRDAAEATYCAMREDKFWDYYHNAIQSLWDDYHSKGIGSSKTATPIKNMPEDYWLQIGHEVGLGEQFDQCVTNHEALDEVIANTQKAIPAADGMPSFKFNRFSTSGFDNNWGWDYVKAYLDAGLGKS